MIRFILLTCSLLLLAGCGKTLGPTLNVDRTVEVEPNESKALTIDAPTKEQKVRLTASSQTANFTVYVALEKDQAAVQQAIDKQIEVKAALLARKERSKDATLDFTVPAKQAFVVFLANESNKKQSIQLKIAEAP